MKKLMRDKEGMHTTYNTLDFFTSTSYYECNWLFTLAAAALLTVVGREHNITLVYPSLRWGLTSTKYSEMTSLLVLLTTLFLILARVLSQALLATWAHFWFLFSQLTSPDLLSPCSFPFILSQACSAAWHCCEQSEELSPWSHWRSHNWPQPTHAAYLDTSIGSSYSQAEQHFLPTLCHMQTY